jgi:tRNA threonylcarbamoyladenosine biosynthesis protein TsaE
MKPVELSDEAATAALAARVAARARAGDVIALSGPLGSGKTTFARGFIRARGGTGPVPSPTFTLVQIYEPGGPAIWHIDLYRLARPDEAWELGIEEAFAEAIALIEWPERAAALIPPHRLSIAFEPGRPRRARLDCGGDWAQRLADD